ncbi:unnamed protein product [Somion occarium]|uniref:TrmE-type G domain-containing protein n=1 Tax=Somion occarium TaxID=3059160 RepID=A0ABP1D2C7_9APHY
MFARTATGQYRLLIHTGSSVCFASNSRLVTAVHSRACPTPGRHINLCSLVGSSGLPDNCRRYRNTAQSEQKLVLSDAQRQTIYALSTPPGKAGIAVIRISGPDALRLWRSVVQLKKTKQESLPEPWKFYRCRVVHPESGEVLDEGLAVYFKGPRSFTGEDVLELHVHSGRAVLSSILNALSCLPYCRLAEPGEFTRRAFAAGRMDLTQVEGLKDLINAETESQRKVALQATAGQLRGWLTQLRTDIIKCLGHVEALIDFSEEDIEEGILDDAKQRARDIARHIGEQLSNFRRGEIMRSGLQLAIFGPPNVGKSSLFNFFAQREAAIVTNVPGTTRDVLEISLDIGGLPVVLADTAGLRETEDIVEKTGIERATDRINTADLSLFVLSLPDLVNGGSSQDSISKNIDSILASEITSDNIYVLLNKRDLLPTETYERLESGLQKWNIRGAWAISLATGEGTREFLEKFEQILKERYGLVDEPTASGPRPLVSNARHSVHLETALRFINAFLDTSDADVILAAEELRYAAQAVGKITGHIDVDDVLDVIFRDFCIGK